jgi:filamentous hemagglutinin
MPVTRIKNNQVTDSSAGNTQVGINAGTKLQDYSLTAGKIANNLTYGSNLTVTGNLTVQGNSTAIDTTITTIEDPIIVLASTQTSGSPAVDIGYLGFRGNQSNIAFVWDESAGQFVTAFTSTGESNTTITITSYANLQIGNLSLTGNILNSSLNVTGNVTAGNLLTPGLISATSTITSAANITGGNILTGGLISASGAITTAGNLSLTGNIVDGGELWINTASNGNINLNPNGTGQVNIPAGNLIVTGNVTGGNLRTAGIVSATGNVTGGNILTGGLISATSTITSAANIAGGNILTGGLISATGTITSAANITGGNLLTGGLISATGTITSAANVTGANITTAGLITATGNINTAGSINLAGNIVDSGPLTITTASGDITLNASGNINAGTNYINNVIDPVQDQDAATKIYVDNRVSTAISYHEAVFAATTANLATTTGGTITYNQPGGAGNGIGATITTTGSFNLIDTANVQTANTRILVKDEGNAVLNGIYVWSNATVITRASTENTAGFANVDALSINDYFFTTSGNVNKGTAFIVDAPSTAIVFGTSNIQFAVFSQTQVYSANTSAGISLTGTVFSALVDNNTTAFSSGNIVVKAGANLTTPNIGAATGTSLSVTANVTGGNITTAGLVTATGNIIGSNILTAGIMSSTGNGIHGNILTGGLISATGNVTGGNVLTGGLISATSTITSAANITGGNLLTGGLISATSTITAAANITGGNILTAGIMSSTGNGIHGNVLTAGLISATGTITSAANVIGGNITTAGLITATGNITGANLILTTGIIDGPAAGRITINGSDIDTDFAVDGDTLANVFYVDAGTGTASFGASTQVTNAIVNFATTTSIKAPVGNTAQRPGTGVTGMLRFNTTNNALEVYDNSAWTSVGTPVFTVIDDQQFAGDGTTVAFTLGSTQTTNSCIVSINGVVQIPTLAYSVAGTNPTCVLTFTEAPAAGDVIDVRQITTTTTVTSIANSSGNAVVAVSPTAALVNVTGDLSVSGTILGGNINSTAITSGTSDMTVVSSGGNIRANIAGTTVQTISPGLVAITGDLSVSGNATLSGNILGDRIQNGNTQIDIQTPSGNANVTVGGTSNVAVFSTSGLSVAGIIGVTGTGNITGANIIATADVFTPEIVKTGSNAVGNIGQSSNYFNTVFAQATSALYADLAEKYAADAEYAPGTVVMFGGTAEVTICSNDACARVAGVVSTNPSYRMNDGLQSEHTAMVALTGRVPTSVTGTVRKGDMMVSAGNGVARAEANPQVGTVIGKALADSEGDAVIEVVVGRV